MNGRGVKTIIALIFCLLVISNSYWLIEKYRTTNREKYEATYDCETKELIFSLRKFPIGISINEFKVITKNNELEFREMWKKEDRLFLEIRNIFFKCPQSGRPYCGITFKFEKDRLKQIEIGYPCH